MSLIFINYIRWILRAPIFSIFYVGYIMSCFLWSHTHIFEYTHNAARLMVVEKLWHEWLPSRHKSIKINIYTNIFNLASVADKHQTHIHTQQQCLYQIPLAYIWLERMNETHLIILLNHKMKRHNHPINKKKQKYKTKYEHKLIWTIEHA